MGDNKFVPWVLQSFDQLDRILNAFPLDDSGGLKNDYIVGLKTYGGLEVPAAFRMARGWIFEIEHVGNYCSFIFRCDRMA